MSFRLTDVKFNCDGGVRSTLQNTSLVFLGTIRDGDACPFASFRSC